MFFQAIFSLKGAQIRLSARFFCDVLTKMLFPATFTLVFCVFSFQGSFCSFFIHKTAV
jgi:hypothetical protein